MGAYAKLASEDEAAEAGRPSSPSSSSEEAWRRSSLDAVERGDATGQLAGMIKGKSKSKRRRESESGRGDWCAAMMRCKVRRRHVRGLARAVLSLVFVLGGLMVSLAAVGAWRGGGGAGASGAAAPPVADSASDCHACHAGSELSLEARIGYARAPTCDMVRRSNLESVECDHHANTVYDLLVTCTGRSGSTFVYGFLTKLGFNIGHDQVSSPYGHGAVAWPMLFSLETFDSVEPDGSKVKRMCEYPTTSRTKRFRTSVHMVRHPLRSIRSRWDVGNFRMQQNTMGWYKSSVCNTDFWNNWPEAHPYRTPKGSMRPDLLSLVATIRHWVLWNTFGAATSEWGFRLEQFADRDQTPGIIAEMCARARVEPQKCPTKEQVHDLHGTVDTYSQHSHKVLEWQFTWEVLFRADPEYALLAQLMALRYGYVVTAGELLPPLFDKYCSGSASALPPAEGFNASAVREADRVACDLGPSQDFPEPLCSLDPRSKLWGCTVPPEIDFDRNAYPKPHFPFDKTGTTTRYRGSRPSHKNHPTSTVP